MKFKLNLKIYPLEAILNACYMFIDKVYIHLDTDSEGKYVKVEFKSKAKGSKKQLSHLREKFMNELLHSTLRYKINKNNKKIREYIVGKALYSALIPAAIPTFTEEALDYRQDPLGISIPWEEKYGKQKENRKV